MKAAVKLQASTCDKRGYSRPFKKMFRRNIEYFLKKRIYEKLAFSEMN